MNHPVVLVKERKLGYKFMVAEAWWILSGRNDVASIAPYAKHIKDFSDDGHYFFGAYGPRIVDQLSYVVASLRRDPLTRQACLTIWRPNPRDTKDVPCTVSVQWFIRDGLLHCIDTMRSSDLWLGWPYDIFNFSMLSRRVLEMLVEADHAHDKMQLGNLYLNAGSQHIYEDDFDRVKSIINKPPDLYPETTHLSLGYPLGDITKYLGFMKDYDPVYPHIAPKGFLNDLFAEAYNKGA